MFFKVKKTLAMGGSSRLERIAQQSTDIFRTHAMPKGPLNGSRFIFSPRRFYGRYFYFLTHRAPAVCC